jgi:DNA-binding GntR family transcriptional regulator
MTNPIRLPNRSQVDQIVESLRDRIRAGAYAPGQRLIESDLTREFKVSRGPVREALGRLRADGLVEHEPHRGASVRRMTRDDVLELLFMRKLLQGGAGRLAALNVDRDGNRRRFKRALTEMRGWTRAKDVVGYMEAGDAVHSTIIEVADNRLLADAIERLGIPAFRLLFAGTLSVERVRESAAGNVKTLTALLAGDADATEAAIHEQLELAAQRALALIEPDGRRAAVAMAPV